MMEQRLVPLDMTSIAGLNTDPSTIGGGEEFTVVQLQQSPLVSTTIIQCTV